MDEEIEIMIHSFALPITRSQAASLEADIEIVDEYIPVDPHMIDGVPLPCHID